VLREIAPSIGERTPPRLCVDATSATLLLALPDGKPLGPALMYDDTQARAEAAEIGARAPLDSPARGAGSSLAKLLHLGRRLPARGPRLALHQADWILGRLTGRFGVSDWNNCLKLGFDPARGVWPDWVTRLDLMGVALPEVLAPGTQVGALTDAVLAATGLPPGSLAVAGTTDSTAAVMATGALTPGDAVTSLGSTLVLKVLGERPVNAPQFGVYSHRLGDLWLIGGASNSGGAVLRRFFDDGQLRRLSEGMDPDRPSGLDYYPLPAPGERFPVNDPCLAPRLSPRPADDRAFLQGLFEGIARIEALGYERLRELGSPPLRRVLTVGGGAANPVWTRIRQRLLGVPVAAAAHQEAAYGAARLASWGPPRGGAGA
jgi:sugar (pentulose or hexulose) kinase